MTKISPLPWTTDPDDRVGMEWNVHIVEQAHPYMRVCFMSNCEMAGANADLIVKAVNHHDGLVSHLRRLATRACDEDALALLQSIG